MADAAYIRMNGKKCPKCETRYPDANMTIAGVCPNCLTEFLRANVPTLVEIQDDPLTKKP